MKRTGTGTRTKDNLNKTLTTRQEPLPAVVDRLGKDEMNLVEHPFALLRYGRNDRNVIEISFTKQHPRTGKNIEARWRVAGDPETGLPGPMEERLYLVLMELTREQGVPQVVSFSRCDVLRRMGLSTSKRDYETLSTAFQRLQAVKINTWRAFWDAASGDFLAESKFSLLDNVNVAVERAGRRTQGTLPLSTFKWNDVIYASMQGGNLRSLNTVFALSLHLPLSLRLYRYLDKHRHDGKKGSRASYQIGLSRLCDVHLGMAPTKFASTMKQRLESAHAELLQRGFLREIIYEPMKTQDGEKVVYVFGDGVPTAALPLPTMSEDEACDAVLLRLKTEDADEYLRIRTDAIDQLNEIERAMWERSGEHSVAWPYVQEHMRVIVEQEYRADVRELMGQP